jgi:hypothetical protein
MEIKMKVKKYSKVRASNHSYISGNRDVKVFARFTVSGKKAIVKNKVAFKESYDLLGSVKFCDDLVDMNTRTKKALFFKKQSSKIRAKKMPLLYV